MFMEIPVRVSGRVRAGRENIRSSGRDLRSFDRHMGLLARFHFSQGLFRKWEKVPGEAPLEFKTHQAESGSGTWKVAGNSLALFPFTPLRAGGGEVDGGTP